MAFSFRPGLSQRERPAVIDGEWPDRNIASNPASFAGFPVPPFLVYRSRLPVGIENFRANRVLEFAGFNAFGSPRYPGNYLFVLLTIFTF
jgi:hypothetical protein